MPVASTDNGIPLPSPRPLSVGWLALPRGISNTPSCTTLPRTPAAVMIGIPHSGPYLALSSRVRTRRVGIGNRRQTAAHLRGLQPQEARPSLGISLQGSGRMGRKEKSMYGIDLCIQRQATPR